MSPKNKARCKLVRVVLASTIGSVLWAGCATQPQVAVVDPEAIAHAPVDLTKRRPDTHPEMRTGIWRMSPRRATASVVESPNIRTPEAVGTVDSTALLSYNPEVINSVAPENQDAIVIEAAGADRPARPSWRERWFKRSSPSTIERKEQREIIIEREIETENQPAPQGYKRSSDTLEDEEGGKLTNIYFVKK